MNRRRLRIIQWSSIIFISLLIIVFSINVVVSRYAYNQIEPRLNKSGATLGSLSINLFLQRATLTNLRTTNQGATTLSSGQKIDIRQIVLDDVSLYQWFVNKNLTIGEILIEDGNIRVNLDQNVKDTSPSTKPSQIHNVSVELLTIKNLRTAVSDSSAVYSANLNGFIKKIQSSDTAAYTKLEWYSFKEVEFDIKKVELILPNGLYQTKISKLSGSSETKTLTIDSLLFIPRHSKYKFAKIATKQIDRINAFIREIKVEGIGFDLFRDSTLTASAIHINEAEVFSFRDKRMPFREKDLKPLPMEALRAIRLGIEIDTIRISKSKITYEEFPSKGFESGKIVFANLDATLTNLSNRYYYNKSEYATLKASANLMNKGLIKATFKLPIKDGLRYHATGSISGMSLFPLNPTLENLAFIRIESGKLNSLHFNFDYSDKFSSGELTINYQDLKIQGLKKERSGEKNDFKTFLINAIVKSDKDKDVPRGERTGTISVERDQQRQIFNFWWKSILSGIKTSVLNPEKKKSG